MWLDLDLEVSLDFDLHQTKSISCDVAWWEDYDACVLALRLLLAELWGKNQTPTFGSLTWPLRSQGDPRSYIWVPIAASRYGRHARFFREALTQLGAKRLGGRTPPLCRGVCRKPLRLARVKVGSHLEADYGGASAQPGEETSVRVPRLSGVPIRVRLWPPPQRHQPGEHGYLTQDQDRYITRREYLDGLGRGRLC